MVTLPSLMVACCLGFDEFLSWLLEHIPIEGWIMVENKRCGKLMIDNHWIESDERVLMIDCLSIVETDKVNHAVETDIVKLVVEIESFGVNFNEFDKETRLFDGLQPKQAYLSCVHALNELHLHEIRVVLNKHEADQY
ncbi:hypothetical protein Tco_1285728 [Tanacetum coccineum]